MDKTEKRILYFMVIVHVGGAIGLLIPAAHNFFRVATPLAAIGYQRDRPYGYWIFLLISFLFGMAIEILGVNTGEIFGVYSYGKTLGPKLMGVPYIIGINWFMLTYGAYLLFPVRLTWLRILFVPIFMVAYDWVMEPVAIALDFWNWQGETIPLQNYIDWFIAATILAIILHLMPFDKHNPFHKGLITIQAIFFIFLRLFLA